MGLQSWENSVLMSASTILSSWARRTYDQILGGLPVSARPRAQYVAAISRYFPEFQREMPRYLSHLIKICMHGVRGGVIFRIS
jgi:hypothetical protein